MEEESISVLASALILPVANGVGGIQGQALTLLAGRRS